MSNRSASVRRQGDISKLLMSGFDVEPEEEASDSSKKVVGSETTFSSTRSSNPNPAFLVSNFRGPENTAYAGAVFRVRVELPANYPFQSPSIGFERNAVWHPNICFSSGSVCLDVLNSLWTPLYSLTNVLDQFLPYLLTHPNCADPLNAEAASELEREPSRYEARVRGIVQEMMRRKGLTMAVAPTNPKSSESSGVALRKNESEEICEPDKNNNNFTEKLQHACSSNVDPERKNAEKTAFFPDSRLSGSTFAGSVASPPSSMRGASPCASTPAKRISLGQMDTDLLTCADAGFGLTGLDDQSEMDAEFD